METVKTQPERAGTLELLSFSGGQFATSIFWAFMTYYLMGFYIDIALIPPELAAVLLSFFFFYSAFSDVMIGLLINRLSLREMKYRSYYKWCALPFALSLSSLCFVPQTSVAGKIAYIIITLIICELLWTMLNIAALSLITYIAKGDQNRSKMVSYSNMGSILAYVVLGTFMMPLVNFFGGANKQMGFATALTMFAALAALLHLNAYYRLRERHDHRQIYRPALREVFSVILRNRRMMLFSAGYCVYWIADSFKNQTTYFYVIYNMGRAELLPLVIMAGLLTSLLVQPFIPNLLAYAQKETLIIGGLFASSAAGFLFFAAGDSIPVLIAYVILYGVFTAIAVNMIITAIVSFSDEIYERQKISMSEVLISIISFSSKIGIAIASGVSPMVLAKTGFLAQEAFQPAAVLAGIRMLYIICTAAGMALCGIIMLFAFRRRLRF